MYLNARSIINKLDDVEEILASIQNIDILIVSETWLKNGEEEYYSINGYQSFYSLRKHRR